MAKPKLIYRTDIDAQFIGKVFRLTDTGQYRIRLYHTDNQRVYIHSCLSPEKEDAIATAHYLVEEVYNGLEEEAA